MKMFEKELEAALEAARKVLPEIMRIYSTDFAVEIKSDDSPVTLADKTADRMIREYLGKLFPDYAFLTEESTDDLARLNNDFVWIVDPLDGTKDFVARDDEFTTNIALAYKHVPVVGVVSIPVKNEFYYAIRGQGAYRIRDGKTEKIHVNDKTTGLRVLTSVFHFTQNEKEAINRHSDRVASIEKCGSSIKACRIAEGSAEVTLRLSDGTKEWDTAAIQCIVLEAGGIFHEPNGPVMEYNREDVYNRKGYIIANREENALL